MRILGIDPGLKLTGYGILEWTAGHDHPLRPPALVDAGVIRLDAKAQMSARLLELEQELDQLFREYKPDVCAVEQLYAHYAHPRTAILMGHARGVILLVAQRHHATLKQFAANRIKQSVAGHGHAGKSQIQRAVQATWNLPEPPEPPDVADAIAIALCCGRSMEVERALGK
jgi:crossover junction endodeoxyribonuclease RuvC